MPSKTSAHQASRCPQAPRICGIFQPRSAKQLVVSGGAAFRMTFLTRGGSVISDREYAAGSNMAHCDSPRCGMVAITCLGVPPTTVTKITPATWRGEFCCGSRRTNGCRGMGAHNLLPQVGPITILGRGACLVFPQSHAPARKKQAVSSAMVLSLTRSPRSPASRPGCRPLPESVMILLDQQDPVGSGRWRPRAGGRRSHAQRLANSHPGRTPSRPALRCEQVT